MYVLIDDNDYRITRFLDPSDLVAGVQAPNQLIFCLQVPESGEPVLAEFRKDQPDGQIVSFPRFYSFPRQLTAPIRDSLVL